MRSELVKCDICGDTYDAKVPRPWHSITVHCTIKVPEDGVNGGNHSGDWCERCRIKFSNKMRELKNEIREELSLASSTPPESGQGETNES